MGVKKVIPVKPNRLVGEVIYVCEICKTETSWRYKTPPAGTASRSKSADAAAR